MDSPDSTDPMDNVRDLNNKIMAACDIFGEKINEVMARQEEHFISCYKTQLYSIRKDLVEPLEGRADIAAMQLASNEKIRSLESERDFYRNECVRMDALAMTLKGENEYLSERLVTVDKDNVFLEQTARRALRNNRLLETQISEASPVLIDQSFISSRLPQTEVAEAKNELILNHSATSNELTGFSNSPPSSPRRNLPVSPYRISFPQPTPSPIRPGTSSATAQQLTQKELQELRQKVTSLAAQVTALKREKAEIFESLSEAIDKARKHRKRSFISGTNINNSTPFKSSSSALSSKQKLDLTISGNQHLLHSPSQNTSNPLLPQSQKLSVPSRVAAQKSASELEKDDILHELVHNDELMKSFKNFLASQIL